MSCSSRRRTNRIGLCEDLPHAARTTLLGPVTLVVLSPAAPLIANPANDLCSYCAVLDGGTPVPPDNAFHGVRSAPTPQKGRAEGDALLGGRLYLDEADYFVVD